MDIEKGTTFYNWQGGTPYLCHVVSVVDDEGTQIMVCKAQAKMGVSSNR